MLFVILLSFSRSDGFGILPSSGVGQLATAEMTENTVTYIPGKPVDWLAVAGDGLGEEGKKILVLMERG